MSGLVFSRAWLSELSFMALHCFLLFFDMIDTPLVEGQIWHYVLAGFHHVFAPLSRKNIVKISKHPLVIFSIPPFCYSVRNCNNH